MLHIDSIEINRYIGIDNTKISIVSEEIQTLKHLSRLDKEKMALTAYNKRNHINIKGFSANFHNWNRNKDNYSIAENLFREQLELNDLTDYLHEYAIQVKDALLKSHNYHLDFYFPSIKLAIEISPLFHFKYETVAVRDKIRTALLKRKHGIKTIVIKVHFRTINKRIETYLNIEDTKQAIKEIKKLKRKKPHKETLLGYF
jgi:hypothetical protein